MSATITKVCETCKNKYEARSARQKWCDNCKPTDAQAAAAKYARIKADPQRPQAKRDRQTASKARLHERIRELEAENAELRAWQKEALAWPPEDGLTAVERRVLRASPAGERGGVK